MIARIASKEVDLPKFMASEMRLQLGSPTTLIGRKVIMAVEDVELARQQLESTWFMNVPLYSEVHRRFLLIWQVAKILF